MAKGLWSEPSTAISQAFSSYTHMKPFPPAWTNGWLAGSSYTPRIDMWSSGMHGGEKLSMPQLWESPNWSLCLRYHRGQGFIRRVCPLRSCHCPFCSRLPSALHPSAPATGLSPVSPRGHALHDPLLWFHLRLPPSDLPLPRGTPERPQTEVLGRAGTEESLNGGASPANSASLGRSSQLH